MSDDITTMYSDAKRGVAYAMNEAMGELQRARIEGDRTAAAEAVLRVNDISIRDQNLDRLYAGARQPAQQQTQAAGRPVRFKDENGQDRIAHMTDDQREIARGIGGTMRGLTDEQREQAYARSQEKYRRMLADGSYTRQAGFGKAG